MLLATFTAEECFLEQSVKKLETISDGMPSDKLDLFEEDLKDENILLKILFQEFSSCLHFLFTIL
jgi:hypothetical protein